jgi:hypothetical protein
MDPALEAPEAGPVSSHDGAARPALALAAAVSALRLPAIELERAAAAAVGATPRPEPAPAVSGNDDGAALALAHEVRAVLGRAGQRLHDLTLRLAEAERARAAADAAVSRIDAAGVAGAVTAELQQRDGELAALRRQLLAAQDHAAAAAHRAACDLVAARTAITDRDRKLDAAVECRRSDLAEGRALTAEVARLAETLGGADSCAALDDLLGDPDTPLEALTAAAETVLVELAQRFPARLAAAEQRAQSAVADVRAAREREAVAAADRDRAVRERDDVSAREREAAAAAAAAAVEVARLRGETAAARRATGGAERTASELAALRAQLADQVRHLQAGEAAARERETALRARERQIAALQDDLDALRTQANEARARAAQADAEVARLREAVVQAQARAQADLAAARAQAAAAMAAAQQAQAGLAEELAQDAAYKEQAHAAECARLREQLAAAEDQADARALAVIEANDAEGAARAELAQVQADAARQRAEAQAKITVLERALDGLRREAVRHQGGRAEVRNRRAGTATDLHPVVAGTGLPVPGDPDQTGEDRLDATTERLDADGTRRSRALDRRAPGDPGTDAARRPGTGSARISDTEAARRPTGDAAAHPSTARLRALRDEIAHSAGAAHEEQIELRRELDQAAQARAEAAKATQAEFAAVQAELNEAGSALDSGTLVELVAERDRLAVALSRAAEAREYLVAQLTAAEAAAAAASAGTARLTNELAQAKAKPDTAKEYARRLEECVATLSETRTRLTETVRVVADERRRAETEKRRGDEAQRQIAALEAELAQSRGSESHLAARVAVLERATARARASTDGDAATGRIAALEAALAQEAKLRQQMQELLGHARVGLRKASEYAT